MVYGIGIDIIEIERIKVSIDKYGEHFINKIFTPNEIVYCESKGNKYQHYAARFSAKEAVSKAFSEAWDNTCGWQSIEVFNEENGKPSVRVFGRLLEFLSTDKEVKLSLTHSHNNVAAVAIIYQIK